MFGWLRWKMRARRWNWSRECGCSFTYRRDGSGLGNRCLEHWLD